MPRITIIETEIARLIDDFMLNPDIFLTEEDVRSYLVSKFLQHPEFSQLSETENQTRSIPLHSEVRWYGRNGKLRYRSDIVFFDTKNLRTKREFNLPSKGYAFDSFYAVIELKLRRMSGRSDSKYMQMIDKDYEKLQILMNEVEDTTGARYYLLCFDKKKNIDLHLARYHDDPRIDFRYVFKAS